MSKLTENSTSWTREQAQEAGELIGHALLGTGSYPLAELDKRDLPDGLLNDQVFCAALDDIAMECSDCNWYVEPGELRDGEVCDDCAD